MDTNAISDFVDGLDFSDADWASVIFGGGSDLSSLSSTGSYDAFAPQVGMSNEDGSDLVFGTRNRAGGYEGLSSDGSVRDAFSSSAPTGLLATASGWIKDNPKLAELLLKGAGGAWAVGKAGENALASTKLQEEIANRKRERIQQSIMGMAEMPRGEQSPLTRMNGSRVYNDKGGLA